MRRPTLQDVSLGQYKASVSKDGKSKVCGYQEEPGVATNSLTPTFIAAVLYIDNARWDGVPFLIKAGSGLINHKYVLRTLNFRTKEAYASVRDILCASVIKHRWKSQFTTFSLLVSFRVIAMSLSPTFLITHSWSEIVILCIRSTEISCFYRCWSFTVLNFLFLSIY